MTIVTARRTAIEREAQIEQHARDTGIHRVRKQIERAIVKGRASDTPAGVVLMKQAIHPIAQAITATVEAAYSGKVGRRMRSAPILRKLPADVLAYFTAKTVVSALVTRTALSTAAVSLGAMIEEELRMCSFDKSDPGLYATILRQLKERRSTSVHAGRVFVFTANKSGVRLPSLSRAEKLLVGIKLLEIFADVTGYVEFQTVRDGKRSRTLIRPTSLVADWFKQFNTASELMHPNYMPTVIPPRDWTSPAGGGYHTNALRALPLVKSSAGSKAPDLNGADLSVVYSGVNAIQQTGWRINRRIFDVMHRAWKNGIDLAMPHKHDLPLPSKPAKFKKADGAEAWSDVPPSERKQWMASARRVHEHNAASMGKRIGLDQILAAAEYVRDEPVIYFPHQLDFRGRAYAVPSGLTPQGNDHARALLEFSEGKPIDTPRQAGWLYIQGANLFGYDKANLEDRIAWVEEHEAAIIRCASDPLGDRWWTEADKPWCFLAWCFEYAAYAAHGWGFVSRFVCSVDGSCNGLQHFSAMLRDPIGGTATNLVPADLPSDIYQRVADRVIERLRELADVDFTGDYTTPRDFSKDFDVRFYATGWLAFGIDRKITKRPVMVLPYGGTFRSCMAYVRDAVTDRIAAGQENPFGEEYAKATAFLAKQVWESISDVVVAAREAMGWLQKVARIASKKGHALSWTAPSGFPARQAYKDMRPFRIKTRLQGSIIQLSLNEETTRLDADRQALGISPNFVHSMDAAAMMLTIDMARLNGVTQFAMIHDSYGTVAADMDVLSTCLRHAFVDMYRDHNVLAEFLSGLPEEVRSECPEPPAMGTLDLGGILASEFFFA